MSSIGIDFPRYGFDSISGNFLELWDYLFNDIAFDVSGVQVLLEFLVGKLKEYFNKEKVTLLPDSNFP